MSTIDCLSASIGNHVRTNHPPHHRPALRDAHAKHHGCLRATFEVVPASHPDPAIDLQRGVFARPGTRYPAWVRFSNALKVRHDLAPDARGVAIKLMDVDGSASRTQDFLMVTHRSFFSYDADDFLDFPATVCDTTLEPRHWLRIVGYFLRARRRSRWRRFRSFAGALRWTDDALRVEYGSQTPFACGDDQLMKYCLRPRDALTALERLRLGLAALRYNLTALLKRTDAGHDLLHDALLRRLRQGAVVLDFMVQVRRPADAAERARLEDDAVTDWSVASFPYVRVAELRLEPLDDGFDTEAMMALGQHLSFNPWHAVPDHRPLGSINAARREVYAQVSGIRHELNRVTIREPEPGETAAVYVAAVTGGPPPPQA